MEDGAQLESFLLRNGLSNETWEKSGCDWRSLLEIGDDHSSRSKNLQESAEFFAKVIQKLTRVHSVRWRVKDADHLMAKVVRKKADGVEKYKGLTVKNYHQIVTDLIGIRALHLFKDECIEIDTELRAVWEPSETPIVYIREGDQGELTTRFAAQGFEVRSHPAGYRSVHYVIESRPLNRSVFVELQVRTIIEEAWSEIDHRIRYPNFSQSELVAYFLTIFNRLSGSADEMGGFVRGLATTLQDLENRVVRASAEKREAIDAMEKTLGEMDAVKQRDKESTKQIDRLKAEVERLKRSGLFGSVIPGLLGTPDAASALRQGAFDDILYASSAASDRLEKTLRDLKSMPTIDFGRLLSDVKSAQQRGEIVPTLKLDTKQKNPPKGGKGKGKPGKV